VSEGQVTGDEGREAQLDLRPCVARFAQEMERRLRYHDDDRGEYGWRDDEECDCKWALGRIQDEVDEASRPLAETSSCDPCPHCGGTKERPDPDYEDAALEAVDIANFAMMLWDLALHELGLPYLKPEERE